MITVGTRFMRQPVLILLVEMAILPLRYHVEQVALKGVATHFAARVHVFLHHALASVSIRATFPRGAQGGNALKMSVVIGRASHRHVRLA